jgi:hypothetical protein
MTGHDYLTIYIGVAGFESKETRLALTHKAPGKPKGGPSEEEPPFGV